MSDNKLKGIILAGGSGTRLYPLTKVITKQLLPVYNKPMIYYPISTLVNSGVTEILIITTEEDSSNFKKLLEDGHEIGAEITFAIQDKPEGIAQAFLIAEQWLGDSSSILILGDNLFFGDDLTKIISNAIDQNQGATIFGYEVENPEKFGVIEFDDNKCVSKIIEKPSSFVSNWAVTGLYIYDNNVIKFAKQLKKSKRGEYEITDLNMLYLIDNNLKVELLNDSLTWMDTGTFDSLLDASNFVKKNKK